MAAIDRYRSGYLHLFYEDYINQGSSDFNGYSQIWAAKQKIQQQATARLKAKIKQVSNNIHPDIEELFNTKESEFENLGGDAQERLDATNSIMTDFDTAISELKKLFKEKSQDLDEASRLGDIITNSIEEILKIGAKTNGLAEGAIKQIEDFKDKYLTEVYPHLKHKTYRTEKAKRNAVIDAITAIQTNISGYMWELANVYAFLGANIPALKKIINIGGENSIQGAMKVIKDPKLLADLEKIQSALTQNTTQAKADNILIVDMEEGNGSVSMTSSYIGLQNKNVADISRIKVGSYTLGQLGIGIYYSENFLVNTAAGLAGNNYRLARSTVAPEERTHQGSNGISQTYVDELWANIKDSVKVLGMADAIAGEANANVTNKIDYYVIRSKTDSQIRIIPVTTILTNILMQNIQNPLDQKMNFIGGKNNSREQYWTINYSNYVSESEAGSREEAAILRSNKAYSQVLTAIMNTKIQIAVNFKAYF